jgi:leader peptidase (prepilin peptidase)/N-methyltransferase
MLIYLWLPMIFILGASVGSLVNVCVYRLPYERSLLWPGSRCGSCLQPIRWYDNIPLVSYWVLRGRCRTCGQTFSTRYFLVELFAGLGFLGIFCLDVFVNASHLDYVQQHIHGPFNWEFASIGVVPLRVWCVALHHAVLFTFLLIVSLCDLNDMEIPLGVTLTGTVVGLVLSMLFAWPFPDTIVRLPRGALDPPQLGLYPWPVWYEFPQGLPAGLEGGSWKLGLYTGLAGAVVGMLVLRGVRFLFTWGRGIEGLGLGDADLMMMAGAFIGWQPVLMAFFVAAFPALLFGVIQLFRKGDQRLPFGPSLAAGVLLTVFFWPGIGKQFWILFRDFRFLLLVGGAGAVLLLVTAVFLRITRGVPEESGA